MILTNCPNCKDAAYLWFDRGQWIIDFDDGMRGPVVNYCPNCGEKLPDNPISSAADAQQHQSSGARSHQQAHTEINGN